MKQYKNEILGLLMLFVVVCVLGFCGCSENPTAPAETQVVPEEMILGWWVADNESDLWFFSNDGHLFRMTVGEPSLQSVWYHFNGLTSTLYVRGFYHETQYRVTFFDGTMTMQEDGEGVVYWRRYN